MGTTYTQPSLKVKFFQISFKDMHENQITVLFSTGQLNLEAIVGLLFDDLQQTSFDLLRRTNDV